MRRIPIQLDEATYRALKLRAFREGRSIAALVRESVAKHLDPARPGSIDDFSFVGSGSSTRDRAERTSENHDRALADASRPSRRARK